MHVQKGLEWCAYMCLFVEVKEFILFGRDILYMIDISETALLINMTAILDIEYHLEFFKCLSEGSISGERFLLSSANQKELCLSLDRTEDQNQLNRNPSSLIPDDGNRFSF